MQLELRGATWRSHDVFGSDKPEAKDTKRPKTEQPILSSGIFVARLILPLPSDMYLARIQSPG